MPNDANQQQQIVKTAGLGVLLAVGLWVLLLVIAANQARQLTGIYEVSIGPLVLNQIVRTTSGNGLTVSFSFEKGLLLYLLIFAVVGAAIGYLKSRRP